MPGPNLTAEEAAEELGRKTSWLYEHWRDLRKKERMPAPLHDGKSPLVWNRAQFYAWLDRGLPKDQRVAAQAYRAAAAAAAGAPHAARQDLEEADWSQRIDRKYVRERT